VVSVRDELRALVEQLPECERARAMLLIEKTDPDYKRPLTENDIAEWVSMHERVSPRALGRRFRIPHDEAVTMLTRFQAQGLVGEPEADSYPVLNPEPPPRTQLNGRHSTTPWRPWRWR
jgi:hypothetical protein